MHRNDVVVRDLTEWQYGFLRTTDSIEEKENVEKKSILRGFDE